MLVDLGPDFSDRIVNTDHVVSLEVDMAGPPNDRFIEDITIIVIKGEGPRWHLRSDHGRYRGAEVLNDLKRRLHVQPADWINQYSFEILRPVYSDSDGARGSLPSQIDRSTSAESKDAQS
jgi:hypothetical protein